ncbi:hypothetical protein ENSA5_41920 [Enhygromyxa salina]|uniref:Uncharacterized protein n=1 Tax=Enhygromyxa salina TaxID=215803 RepID=A0A2S9XM78_9BACT|nr:TIGR02996 domain-containing protein [Enhygromyxa salina]PRP93791.1 hypothetical protein ENSA5_41920 [Enhygromyxa salina]
MSEARRALARSLETATTAMAAGRHGAMAEHLRAAWRESRNPSVAGLYELLLARVRAEPLAGRDPAERARSWRERADRGRGDPLLLPVLLDEPWHPDLPELERLRVLADWTPDPLLAAAMASRLRLPLTPVEAPGAAEVAANTVRLLAAQRDPRQLATLEQLAREPGVGSELRRQLRGAISSLSAVSIVQLDAGARAAQTQLEHRARDQRAREARTAALRDAIYADPDADARRLVYADWLTEQGDPRGEFITLQLARAGTDAPASARERELLRRHEAEWAGVLHAVLGRDGRVFERGFLSAASIEVGKLDAEIVGASEWSTLRSLDGHVPELLALRGRLDRLRSLYGFLDLERFVALRAAGRLESVEHYECSLADPNLRFDTPLGLRSLLVRRAVNAQLLVLIDSPTCVGLEEFAVYYHRKRGQVRDWVGDHREDPYLRTRYELLRDRLPEHVRRLRMIDGATTRATRPEGCTVTIERDAADRLTQVTLDVHAPLDPSSARSPAPQQTQALLDGLSPLLDAGLSQLTLARVDTAHYDRPGLSRALRERAHASDVEFVDARAASDEPGQRVPR